MTFGIYIAGPMRGYPEFNFPSFDECAEYLRSLMLGDVVIFNPAERDRATGFDPSGCEGTMEELKELGFDLAAAMQADLDFINNEGSCIIMLPGWSRSSGAKGELELAKSLGQLVHYYDPTASSGVRLRGMPLPEDRVYGLTEETPTYQEAVRQSCASCGDSRSKPCPLEPSFVTASGELDDVELDEMDAHAAQVEADKLQERWGPLFEEFLAQEAPSEEVRITNELTGGAKGSKPARFDLIPVGPLTELAKLYGKGAAKYADRNWEQGYDWSLSYAALMRHVTQFWGGEDRDEETGLSHLASVCFHAMAMMEWATTHPELDNRPWPRPDLEAPTEFEMARVDL